MSTPQKINLSTAYIDDLTFFTEPAIESWAEHIYTPAMSSNFGVRGGILRNPTLPVSFLRSILSGEMFDANDSRISGLLMNPQLPSSFIEEMYQEYVPPGSLPGRKASILLDSFVSNPSTPSSLLMHIHNEIYKENLNAALFANPNCPDHLLVSALLGEEEIIPAAKRVAYYSPNVTEEHVKLVNLTELNLLISVNRNLPTRLLNEWLEDVKSSPGEHSMGHSLAESPSVRDADLREFIFTDIRLMNAATHNFNASSETLEEIYASIKKNARDGDQSINHYGFLRFAEHPNTSTEILSDILHLTLNRKLRWGDSVGTGIYSKIALNHNTSQETLEELISFLSTIPENDYFREGLLKQAGRMLNIFHADYQDMPWEWLEGYLSK